MGILQLIYLTLGILIILSSVALAVSKTVVIQIWLIPLYTVVSIIIFIMSFTAQPNNFYFIRGLTVFFEAICILGTILFYKTNKIIISKLCLILGLLGNSIVLYL